MTNPHVLHMQMIENAYNMYAILSVIRRCDETTTVYNYVLHYYDSCPTPDMVLSGIFSLLYPDLLYGDNYARTFVIYKYVFISYITLRRLQPREGRYSTTRLSATKMARIDSDTVPRT